MDRLAKVPDCGHFDIFIDRNGVWFHQGIEIKRKELSRLFSSVLSRDEAGQYWLITPAERGRVDVEQHPFYVIDYYWDKGTLVAVTSIGTEVSVSKEHPLRLVEDPTTLEHYLIVEFGQGLSAKFSRNTYYHLVEEAQIGQTEEEGDVLILESAGEIFTLCV